MTITPKTATVRVGESVTLAASLPGVKWSSSAPSVARVSASGVVTGLAPGSVTITARKGSHRAMSIIQVSDALVQPVPVPAPIPAPVPVPAPTGLIAGAGQYGTYYSWQHMATTKPNNPAGDPAFMPVFSWFGDPDQVDVSWTTTGWQVQMGGDNTPAAESDTRGLYVHFLPIGSGGYTWPGSYFRTFAVQDPGVDWTGINRLAVLVKMAVDHPDEKGYFGSYTRRHDATNTGQGNHWYHGFRHRFKAGQWSVLILNRTPNHQVGGDSNANWGDDPSMDQSDDYAPVHYYDGLTRFYLTCYTQGEPNAGALNGEICILKGFDYGLATSEDDDEIYTVLGVYNGTNYVVDFSAIKNTARTFDIRYSTVGSLHSAGFLTGTDGGTVSNPGDAYIHCRWTSGAMSESATGLWVAIRRQGVSPDTKFTELYIPTQASMAAL